MFVVMKEIIEDSTLTKVTDEYRTKNRLSLFGLICSGDIFMKSGKGFGYVKVRERLHIVRYKEFDSGYSYQHYWGREYMQWEFVNFL